MRFFHFLSILLAILSCPVLTSATVLPATLTVSSGEGFLIRLDLPGDVPLQNCQLTRNTKLYLLSPGNNNSHALVTGELVKPFDYNNTYECGVRVLNTNSLSGGQWKLTAVDEEGNEKSGSSEVTVFYDELDCPRDSSNCVIVDWDTMQETSCSSFSFNSTTGYHCEFLTTGRLTPIVVDHRKNAQENIVGLSVTQTGSHVLECRYPVASDVTVQECVIEHLASGKMFSIQDGLQNSRYSAYKTNFNKGICQFEIPREIAEHEIGFWSMTMNVKIMKLRADHYYYNGDDRYYIDYDTMTCKFQLKGNSTLAKERILQRTNSTVVIKTTKDNVTISCAKNVYYPITLCYLVKGGVLEFSKDSYEDGNCEFKVPPGKWTCGFNAPKEDEPDFKQTFEVIKYDKEIVDEALHVDESGVKTMDCHLIDKRPIKQCILVSPSGVVYRPPKDTFVSDEFSFYSGGRMMTGDCGITFGQDVDVEAGDWQCIIVKMNNDELTTIINNPGDVEKVEEVTGVAEEDVESNLIMD